MCAPFRSSAERVSQAKKRLGNRHLSNEKVSDQTGFSSNAEFSLALKRDPGTASFEYQKAQLSTRHLVKEEIAN